MIHNKANSNIPNIYWSSDAYKFAFVLTNDFDNGVEGFYYNDYNYKSLATSNNSQAKANKGAQEFVLINGKKSNIKVTSDGSFTIKQEDLKGLILPVYIRFPYSLKNLQHANTLVYVLEKSGNKQILPFSFYQNGEIKLLIYEAGNYVLSDLNPSFDDIDTHRAKEAVAEMRAYELISGTGENLFSPLAYPDRGSIATLLMNLIEKVLQE